MSKAVFKLSLLGISILFFFGIFAPDSPVMWMATTSDLYTGIRLVAMLMLIALLLTHPPRNIYLRMVIGSLAVVLASWTLSMTYQNKMQFLDCLSLLQVSISTGLAVLERDLVVHENKLRFGRRRWQPTATPNWL